MSDLAEETKTLVTIHRHITLVQKYMHQIAQELERRAAVHDVSKFQDDEFAGFVQINHIAREHEYSSDEYKAALSEVDAVELHYSRNSHHPEYHRGGIHDMTLVDIIEMVCDWKAAAETYGQSTLKRSIPIQIKRFGLMGRHVYLIDLVVKALEENG